MNIQAKAYKDQNSDVPYLIVTGTVMTPTDKVSITFDHVNDFNPTIMTLTMKIMEEDGPMKMTPKQFIYGYSGERLPELKQVVLKWNDATVTVDIKVATNPFS